MFTGLCETTARVKGLHRRGPDARIALGVASIDARELALGESISVSGVCLTVTAIKGGGFEADASAETLRVTTLGELLVGSEVNIERSLCLGDRMGGHVVLGHVDGIAKIRAVEPIGTARRIVVGPPAELRGFIAAKGSVALDGVSLTVNRVDDAGFDLMLVPHTLAVTTLKDWHVGQNINIEVDVLARYVARQLDVSRASPDGSAPVGGGGGGDDALHAKLVEGGFIA